MQWLLERLELSRGGSRNMLPMEGLRGIAVFLVFLVHFVSLSAPWFASVGWLAALLNGVHAIGNTGVDLFFLLSGYLIYGTLMRRDQPFARFMLRRVRRIYPAFLVVFAVYLVLAIVMPSLGKLPATGLPQYILANLLLLPGLFPIEPLITVAWSLSYEMFFYLFLPIAIASGKFRAWSPTNRIVGLLVLAAVLFAYCAAATGPVRLAMFVAGMLLHELLSVTIWRPAPSLAAISGFAAVLLKVIPTEGSVGFTLKVVALFFGFGLLCWSCLAQPHSWLGLGLSWAPLRWLGNISYSYYLVHGLALQAGFKLATTMLPAAQWGVLGGALLLPATFALSLLPSLLLYLIVERPLSLVPGEQTRRSVDVFPMNVIDDKEPT